MKSNGKRLLNYPNFEVVSSLNQLVRLVRPSTKSLEPSVVLESQAVIEAIRLQQSIERFAF